MVTWVVSGKCEKLNHIRCEWIEWNKNFKWNQLSNEVYCSMLPYLNRNHYSRIEWMILRFFRELGLLIIFRKCFCPSLACVLSIEFQVYNFFFIQVNMGIIWVYTLSIREFFNSFLLSPFPIMALWLNRRL